MKKHGVCDSVGIKAKMNKMKCILRYIILCKIFGLHKWTAPIMEGAKPKGPFTSLMQLDYSLYKFSRMTCACCGVESRQSKEFLKRLNKIHSHVWN